MTVKADSSFVPQPASNISSRFRTFWRSLRADIHEGRVAWMLERAAQRELATYSSPADVHDLLGCTRSSEGIRAEQTRAAVAENLRYDRFAS